MFFFCDSGQVLTQLCQRLQSIQPRGSVPKQQALAEPLLPWGGLRAARDSANTMPRPSILLAAVTMQVVRGWSTRSWDVGATTEMGSCHVVPELTVDHCAVPCDAMWSPRAPHNVEIHGKHWGGQRPQDTHWRGARQHCHLFP